MKKEVEPEDCKPRYFVPSKILTCLELCGSFLLANLFSHYIITQAGEEPESSVMSFCLFLNCYSLHARVLC